MALFKCKMCGGALEINNETVATCEYCGTKQTLPRLEDEKRSQMYDRANHFRRNNEFDKAMGIYEQILNEDSTDAEAYWSLVLCRYGIEYVEDPSSHKRIPTVNRAQFTSIFDDDNYKSALEYADVYQKSIYEEEAKTINEIQKGILSISQKEEPFDVFICYKETDNNGRRTPDSVLANELYHQLKQEGFKVFFARITLEDKLGSAYEPYIFAALNSSKVMVVLGTKPEYFNAVWVKNEWSRYLSLIKNGANKMLIPAYKDMDPYDLPEEFSHLQAQDMSKLGFMQDLIRGIKKIVKADKPTQKVEKETVVASSNMNIAPLLERVFMFLEDSDWQSADEYCEKVLDIEPKCARAYLGKLMAEQRVNLENGLCDCREPFDESDNYNKIMRFADEALKVKLKKDIEHINTRNENDRLEGIYNRATNAMNSATTEQEFKNAASIFKTINDYKDSTSLIEQCLDKAEIARKDKILAQGKEQMTLQSIYKYEAAIMLFESIAGWKDADEQIVKCKQKIEEIKAKEETERLEKERQEQLAKIKAERIKTLIKKIAIITTSVVCVIVAFVIVLNTVILPIQKRNKFIAEFGKDTYEKFGLIEIGSCITFGSYEQDNNMANGKEAVEWIVLEKKGNSFLFISKYGLDTKQYNISETDVTWETCTLRKWLNNNFLNTTFSDEEKAMIRGVTVSADKNPENSTNPGNATLDKVFLLSIKEVNEYFNSDRAMLCGVTDYAVANHAHVSDRGNCYWWLRSPGYFQKDAAYVLDDGIRVGGVNVNGHRVSYDFIAVRPALWIELK